MQIRGDSLESESQMRVWSSKMAIFASFVHCLPNILGHRPTYTATRQPSRDATVDKLGDIWLVGPMKMAGSHLTFFVSNFWGGVWGGGLGRGNLHVSPIFQGH